MTRNVIDDGYTKDGFIKAVEHHHDSLTFQFRPMLPGKVEQVERAISKEEDPETGVNIMAVELAAHLVKWSEKMADGKDRPITWENVARLNYKVLNRLYRIVSGLEPCDPPAQPTRIESMSYAEAIKAKIAGKMPGQVEQEADLKNLGRG